MPLITSYVLIPSSKVCLGTGMSFLKRKTELPFLESGFTWTSWSWSQNSLCGRQFWKWTDLVAEHKVNVFMITVLECDLTNIKYNWSLKRKEVTRHRTDFHVSTPLWRPRLMPGERSSVSKSQRWDHSIFQITVSARGRRNVSWLGLKKMLLLLWAKMLFKQVSESAGNVTVGANLLSVDGSTYMASFARTGSF